MRGESFSAWASRRRVAFGFLERNVSDPWRNAECERITLRSLVLHNDAARESFLRGPDLDCMIRSAFVGGYDFLFVLAPGSYIRDKPGLIEPLEAEIERGFLVAGHVLDRGRRYYTLHHQCLLVSLEVWAEIGCPTFGSPSPGPKRLHRARRSAENHHDGYTPLWIEPSGETAEYEEVQPGWHFVHAALEAGARVAPFPASIRERKSYLYPGDDGGYAERLAKHRRLAEVWGEAAWVANTERPPDSAIPGPVSAIVSVASGLATYRLLDRAGFDERTVVRYVDSSEATLAWKRWLLGSWSGEDYAGAVRSWLRDNPRFAPQAGLTDAELSATDLRGGWERFRRLPHEFHRADLLTADRERVASLVAPGSTTTVVWWSNVFHSMQTHTLLSEEENAEAYRAWIAALRARSPHAFALGTDPQRRPVAARAGDLRFEGRDLASNLYFPEAVLSFFSAEQDRLRRLRRP